MYYYFIKKEKKFLVLLLLNIPIIILLFIRNKTSFIDIERFYFLWVLVFYFYLILEISKIKINNYLIIFSICLIYFNSFLFLYSFYKYEISFNKSQNLYLPIKHILKKDDEIKNLNIITNLNINEFDINLYPNLKNVNFYKEQNTINNCPDVENNTYLLISIKKKDISSICYNLEKNHKKKFLFKNSFYQVDIY